MTPPRDVEVSDTSEHVNITWKSGYENHMRLKDIDYELLLQKSHSSWSQVRFTVIKIHTVTTVQLQLNLTVFGLLFPQTLKPRQMFESIPKSSFDPDATYCIKVRSKPLNKNYNATWSEWSPTTCWENDAQIGKRSLFFLQWWHGTIYQWCLHMY